MKSKTIYDALMVAIEEGISVEFSKCQSNGNIGCLMLTARKDKIETCLVIDPNLPDFIKDTAIIEGIEQAQEAINNFKK